MLFHPPPILLIQLRPLLLEFGAPIARLDHTRPALARSAATHALDFAGGRAAAGRIPPARASREAAALGLARAHAPRRHLLARHEAHQADQDRADLPRRVEALRVEVRDAEAEPCRRLEAAARRVHANRGRGEGVVWREHERAPVLAAFIGGFGRAGQDVVPFEDVALGGMRNDVGRRVFGNGFVFPGETLVGGAGGHDGNEG